MKRNLSIYVHVPFCRRKCAYCDFLSWEGKENDIEKYFETLRGDILDFGRKDEFLIRTVFIGGGTPSSVKSRFICGIMEWLKKSFHMADDAEVTVEVNPGTLVKGMIEDYVRSGVNRISLGVQSCWEDELKALGRIHTYEQVLDSCEKIRQEGIKNLNIDLMSGLPGQDVGRWKRNLEIAVRLKPEHISAYGLIVEEGTVFHRRYGEDVQRREQGEQTLYLPNEADERQMYEITGEILQKHGYDKYEISNYAKEGYACRHNIVYWTGGEYAGFGLGAASYIDGARYTKNKNLKEYISNPGQLCEYTELSLKEKMEEFMFLGLRMTQGILKNEFKERFGKNIEEVYATVIQKMMHKELLAENSQRLWLTEKGIDLSNYVMSEFLL